MKILLACPDPLLCKMIKLSLKQLKGNISTVQSEGAFVNICNKCDYNVIITMFIHPFLCGGDIVKRIKDDNPAKPTIFLLSWLQHEQTVLSLYESGVDQYLTLPINLPRLVYKIALTISSSKL